MRKSLVCLAVATSLFSAFAQAETATYALDPTHTFVTFEIGHFGTSTNRGRFDKKEGTVQLDRAGKTGKVEVTIDTTSINSGTPAFDKHLQSPDFLSSTLPARKWLISLETRSISQTTKRAWRGLMGLVVSIAGRQTAISERASSRSSRSAFFRPLFAPSADECA